MTNLEFNIIMKLLKANCIENEYGKEYFIGSTKINFESRKAVINNLPYNVQMILFEKYPELISELLYSHCYSLTDFSIFTKENLTKVIYELKRYYDYYSFLDDENSLNNYIVSVYDKIIENVIPTIGTHKWMENDEINDVTFLRDKSNSGNIFGVLSFRDILDKFDMAVNPYMIENVKLDTMSNYLNNVNISGNVWSEYNEENGYERNGCCNLTITDKKTCNKAVYERHINGFSCLFEYTQNDDMLIEVKHSYNGDSNDSYKRGEIISITCHEDGKTKNINYNITKNKVFEYSEDSKKIIVKPMTFKQKTELYWQLLSVIEKANESIINNMTVNELKKYWN